MITHCAPISGVATYGDRYVATAGYDNSVILWEAGTGTGLARSWHDHLANQCSFSRDGRWLVTSSSDWSSRVWSLPDMRLHAVLNGHEDDVEMSVFHPDGGLVATACRDHRVRVFRLDGELVRTFRGHTADVNSVEWSAAGQLVSASDDCTIRRWSMQTGECVGVLDMAGVETDTVVAAADGTIYAGNDAGEILVLNDGGLVNRIPAHDAGIKRLVHSPELGLLVSLSYDRTATLWRVSGTTLETVLTTALPADVWPRSCAFAGRDRLVFGTFGQTYRTFCYAEDGGPAGRWVGTPIPTTPGVNAVAALPGGRVLCIGDSGTGWALSDSGGRRPVAEVGSLCNFLTPAGDVVLTGGQLGTVFDALTGRPLRQHRSPLNCGTTFTRQGSLHAVLGSYTGEGLLLRVDGHNVTHERDLPLLSNAIKGIAAGCSLLFAVGADCSAGWWDLETLEQVRVARHVHERIINGCVWLGADDFASVGRDRMLRLFHNTDEAQAVRTPHSHSVKCVSASRDGRLVATGGYDGTVCLFDRDRDTWRWVRRPTTSGISNLTYDAGRAEFLASSYDGHVYRLRP